MNLTDYKIKELRYTHGTYRLGESAEIIDEGGFYRIDGTLIFNKYKILSVEKNDDRIKTKMKGKDVVLIL